MYIHSERSLHLKLSHPSPNWFLTIKAEYLLYSLLSYYKIVNIRSDQYVKQKGHFELSGSIFELCLNTGTWIVQYSGDITSNVPTLNELCGDHTRPNASMLYVHLQSHVHVCPWLLKSLTALFWNIVFGNLKYMNTKVVMLLFDFVSIACIC